VFQNHPATTGFDLQDLFNKHAPPREIVVVVRCVRGSSTTQAKKKLKIKKMRRT
jgi:hypothetical protein